MANSTRPAEFIYDNMMIHGTVVHASHAVRRAASCSTSARRASTRAQATQPITEEQLLTGPLEPTNEWYAIAKIAGIKLCQAYRRQYGCDFISAMPTNLYGPNDNFDLTSQPRAAGADPQVPRRQGDRLPREVEIWGTGVADARVPARRRPRRRVPVPDGALQRRQPHQRRHRRRPDDPRARREGARHRLPRGGVALRHVEARRHAAQGARRHRARATSAGSRRSTSTPASATPTSGSSISRPRTPTSAASPNLLRWGQALRNNFRVAVRRAHVGAWERDDDGTRSGGGCGRSGPAPPC